MKPLLTYPCIAQFKSVVELKDFRPKTKKEYVRYLGKLAEHFQCDPATLSEDQVREYFLFLRQYKNYGGPAMTIARAVFHSAADGNSVTNNPEFAFP